ncbi:putative regulatory protein, FmdB family [Pseudonocardia thermophila]|jgi:Uncharacterized protein conserved in bacteria|uniref:Putative regulatory protein, FmdB family n=1 Tax=Pseudonocardia thermophila TaxID=1848 RepID=A0A1M6UJM4_PSETH|nr:zinc ribbon domain-containing protein [Pseudonocardia thermophila]SHK69308.1 putative regulatory protein, FmdB family [Pseudonocardia thermophila]
MATYSYRCAADGAVDVRLPIGTAPSVIDCPACGAPAQRRYTSPMLGLAHKGAMALLDRAERSRTEPEVVTSLPTKARRPAPKLDPRTARLPRP